MRVTSAQDLQTAGDVRLSGLCACTAAAAALMSRGRRSNDGCTSSSPWRNSAFSSGGVDEHALGDVVAPTQVQLSHAAGLVTVREAAFQPRHQSEEMDFAIKAIELSQSLPEQWLTADSEAKRAIPQIVHLNCRLDDATLVPAMRKPFDLLAEGPFSANSAQDRI